MYYLKKRSGKKQETNPTNATYTEKIKIVTALNLLQATTRMFFIYVMLTGGIGEFLEVSISTGTLNALSVMFFTLGVTGAISVFGIITQKTWALKAMLAVNVSTIIFDIWGYMIQSSAFIGFIVPVLTILLILIEKSSWRALK